jgi:hypothetical protein
MRFKNCTLAYAKDIYMQKVHAIQKNDREKIKYLNDAFPEIFNAKFLMDLLKNEFEREKAGLDDNIIMKFNLFQYQ